MSCKKAFTLIELLVVISIIALLMAILLPVFSRTREQARILIVNSELYNIGVALDSYSLDYDGYPPVRADCNPAARKHAYALPQELVDLDYLPKGQIGKVRFAKIDDKFNKGCSYKYIRVGPMYDYHGTPFGNQYLCVPDGFPDGIKTNLIKYKEPDFSPIAWALFSIGPNYDKQSLEERNFPIKDGFPISKRFWYSSGNRKGILTRIKMKQSRYVGTFENKG